jgi:CO/xanthine dehydrogenase FAD-binding subunit
LSSLAFKPRYYLIPKSHDELVGYLKEYGERGKIIAGGTGIYEVAHRGLLSDLEALIDVSRLGLSYVNVSKSSVTIGATTTMSTLLAFNEIRNRKDLSCIVDALRAIQPTQVKNVATIAGAVCTALPFFDLPVALLSLEARIRVAPNDKLVSLSDFIKGYFSVGLVEGEYVREIELPLERERTASAFQKFALTHDDWALINCGASVSLDNNGKVSQCTIVFGGGVGEKPVRATSLENALIDVHASDEPKIKSFFESGVTKDLNTVSDIRSSSEYRMQLAAVIGRRTFLQATKRI